MPLSSCATRPGLSAASVAGTVSAEEEPGRVGAIAGRGSPIGTQLSHDSTGRGSRDIDGPPKGRPAVPPRTHSCMTMHRRLIPGTSSFGVLWATSLTGPVAVGAGCQAHANDAL